MTCSAGIWHYLGRLWRWGDKWLVHIWLGIPLLAGFMGWLSGGLDQYQDLGDYAVNAPRIERTGMIRNIDARHRYQDLLVGNERIPITCTVPANGYCVQYIAPLSAKVRYFQYIGQNVIIDLVNNRGNHLIKEEEEVASFIKSMPSHTKDTTSIRVGKMALMSFALVIPLIIGILIFRLIGNFNSKKNGVGRVVASMAALGLGGCGHIAASGGGGAGRGVVWVYSPPTRAGEAGRVIQIAPDDDRPSAEKVEPRSGDRYDHGYDRPRERAEGAKGDR